MEKHIKLPKEGIVIETSLGNVIIKGDLQGPEGRSVTSIALSPDSVGPGKVIVIGYGNTRMMRLKPDETSFVDPWEREQQKKLILAVAEAVLDMGLELFTGLGPIEDEFLERALDKVQEKNQS